jgi:hypothetical protein
MIFSSINTPPGFYVYAYLREDGTPYYIGKGKDKRAWKKGNGEVHPPKDHNRIIITHWDLTELWSLAMERWFIRWYGRKDKNTGILRNQTDGGDGVAGREMTPADRKRISDAKIGVSIWTEEARAKMSEDRSGDGHWNYGNSTPQEVSDKISDGLKRYHLLTPPPVKNYTLIDTLTGEETVFNIRTAESILKPLDINKKELIKVARHTNRLYKKRYTVKF